ncbi:fimbria/pilus outer membrane usher protein [Klebsiella spallanzanii]|uniref:Outer membrane usher protein FimD n=1 Tax=Klebsiella spallanzanii TaxID=2587528 RepID=A0A564NU99_9ENTR|nr:fimbria/pilus outer membrane usher protein [Klebsiella spallanzanii]VUT09886.1 Outer membrane usher protein FimD [Klebsiella spallanzanii]
MNANNGINARLPLVRYVLIVAIFCAQAHAEDYFDPAFLEKRPQNNAIPTDLSAFSTDQSQVPGRYYVDVLINGVTVESRNIEFHLATLSDGKQALQGCLSAKELSGYGVKTDLFPALTNQTCIDLATIPAATQQFDFQRQQLRISIPQRYLAIGLRDYVPPEKWDEGLPALLLNYSFNSYQDIRSSEDNDNNSTKFLALQPGINLGAWRFRHYSNWSSQGEDNRWSTVYNYLQRDIISLKSQLTLWDSTTTSEIFDSVPFRGAQIASDDQMQPNSQRGYAPTIHGVARTNAQVIVRQNGRIAYQTSVAPGEFEISDMFATGSSGDYDVTIKEADGSEQHLVIPYSSLPNLQREGRLKYSITTGKYRDNNNRAGDSFTQATLLYGLPWGITAYGGGQISGDRYQSLALGLGQNMQMLGAISVDGIWSHAKFTAGHQETGQSWRIRYSKGMMSTGTNISIAGYRYASEHFNTLEDRLNADNKYDNANGKQRNRFEATINQQLSSGLGAVSLSWVKEDYWHSSQQMQSISIGYNNSWRQISYALNYSYNKNTWQNTDASDDGSDYSNDRQFSFSVNIPFSLFSNRMYASYMFNTRKNGASTSSTTLSGTALADNNLSWSAQESHSNDSGDAGGVSASYKGTYGNLSAGYSWSANAQQISYGMTGGIIAHENGVTLSQPITGAAILVAAPGAIGVAVKNQTGVKTDFRGYTVIPNVTPYYRYDISLDSQTFADDIDMPVNNQVVYPTRNAVVRAAFSTHKGYRTLMTLTRPNGTPVPFGATASINESNDGLANIVGDSGLVFLSGLPEEGKLTVKWGDQPNEACHASYRLDPKKNMNGIVTSSARCR